MEAMLRDADARLEKWFRAAKKGSAGILRHRVDDLQAGLKKLSTRLEHLERERAISPTAQPEGDDHKATPRKRRPRPAIARKPSAARKHKKAA
jgi:hypothetical protein